MSIMRPVTFKPMTVILPSYRTKCWHLAAVLSRHGASADAIQTYRYGRGGDGQNDDGVGSAELTSGVHVGDM